MKYATYSFEALPDEMRMTKEQRIQLKITFDMLCNRQTGKMEGKNCVHYFAEFSKAHTFSIPLQPNFLMAIANPYFDNLYNFVSDFYFFS